MGRYETLRKIASGGMATVYVGRAMGPAGFERLVAIKVMHEHIAEDPDFSAMFLDEARLAARIRHPNVVPTLDVAEDGHYIVMDLVEGASLRDVLYHRRDEGLGPMPVACTLRIMLDTLEGLQAAHTLLGPDGKGLNIVHRDVSPHNILVGIDGISRITDFGIAYAEARLTQTESGQLKGKMPYMAPEQLEGHALDQRVDVYAAGCVLWEMLVGRRLFAGPSEAALAVKVLQGPQESPRAHNPAVPVEIDEVCMRALSAEDARYPSALAFIEALEEAAEKSDERVARPRAVARLTDGIRFELTPDDHAAASSLPVSSDSQSGLRKPGDEALPSTVAHGVATDPDPAPATTERNTARGLGPETAGPSQVPSAQTQPHAAKDLPLAARPVGVGDATPSTPAEASPKSQTLISTASGDEHPSAAKPKEALSTSSLTAAEPVPAPPLESGPLPLWVVAVGALLLGGAGAVWWMNRAPVEAPPALDASVSADLPGSRTPAPTAKTTSAPSPPDASGPPPTPPTTETVSPTRPAAKLAPNPKRATPSTKKTASQPTPPPPDPDSPSTFHPSRP